MAIQSAPRAPYASDPARSRGRLVAEPPSPTPQRFPARPRPHHPFHRLPPPQVQDPGLRVPRGRPLPHPADPYPRGRSRSPARWRARSGSTRISPRRSRSRTISATRRSGMPASARSTHALQRYRRLRPQRADAAHRHRARAPLRRFRRSQPDLGNARRAGQAQRPADRPRRQRRSGAIASTGVPQAIARLSAHSTTCSSGAMPAPRRRSRPSPTTSPTTPTTSTTVCAPACSRSTISRRCRSPAASCAKSGERYPDARAARASRMNWSAV